MIQEMANQINTNSKDIKLNIQLDSNIMPKKELDNKFTEKYKDLLE